SFAERGNIGDQGGNLSLVGRRLRVPRLLMRILERHVARRQVEVGRQCAHVFQRGAEPAHVEDAARMQGRGDAAAVDAVAAQAVLGVEALAGLGLDAEARLGGCGGGKRQRQREREQEKASHADRQGSWTIAPTPLRTMITRKSRLPSAAARTKKWRRPSGAGPL